MSVNYGFALVSCLAALSLTKMIKPFADANFFELFQAAVVLSAWYGGMGPGIFAGILSFFLIDYTFIAPINAFAFNLEEEWRFVIFGIVAVLAGSLSGKLKWAKTELEKAHDELEQRIEKRTEELSRAVSQLKEEMAQRKEAQKAILEVSDREQHRLGQDLHDGLIQVLTGVRFISEGLKSKLAGEKHPLSDDMQLVESSVNDALAQADTIARGLYPVELEKHGLMAALEELAHKISKVYPVACQFVCRDPVFNEPSTSTHLYRIAQEAVSNAIKGGKAKQVRIRLSQKNDRIYLNVADNGVGFKRGHIRNGMGLKIMEYRAKMINADLKFQSRTRGGTVVTCAFQPKLNEEEQNNEK